VTEDDRNAFTELLVEAFRFRRPRNRTLDDDLLRDYWDALKDLPLDVVREGFERHRKRGRGFPLPADLRPPVDPEEEAREQEEISRSSPPPIDPDAVAHDALGKVFQLVDVLRADGSAVVDTVAMGKTLLAGAQAMRISHTVSTETASLCIATVHRIAELLIDRRLLCDTPSERDSRELKFYRNAVAWILKKAPEARTGDLPDEPPAGAPS